MSDSEHVVVAGVLQRPTRMAEVAKLDLDFFTDKRARALFSYAQAFYTRRGGRNALDVALARTKLEQSEAKKAPELLGLLGEYEGYQSITDPEFREALDVIGRDRQRRLIREHGVASVEAVLEGDWKGAKEAMRSGLLAIDDADLEDDRPADVRGADEIRDERLEVEKPPEKLAAGFDVGFKFITDAVSLRRGELTILGGYTANGKTQLSKAIVSNANHASGADVLYVALEMDRREMRVLFLAQHAARLDPKGVDYRSILDGTASARDKKLYKRALDDFEIRPDEDGETATGERGSIHVWAPRKRLAMRRLVDRVRGMKQDVGLDIVVIDYLELVQADKDLGAYRLNVKDMAERGKALAREEDVWVIVNHQISRGGRDAAEKRKPRHYLLRDLGESSGVERAADHVLWVYCDDDLKEEHEAKVGIAKARKGRTIATGRHVYANFPRSLLGELRE